VADLIAADAEKAAAAMFFGDGDSPGGDASAKSSKRSRRTFDRPL